MPPDNPVAFRLIRENSALRSKLGQEHVDEAVKAIDGLGIIVAKALGGDTRAVDALKQLRTILLSVMGSDKMLVVPTDEKGPDRP